MADDRDDPIFASTRRLLAATAIGLVVNVLLVSVLMLPRVAPIASGLVGLIGGSVPGTRAVGLRSTRDYLTVTAAMAVVVLGLVTIAVVAFLYGLRRGGL